MKKHISKSLSSIESTSQIVQLEKLIKKYSSQIIGVSTCMIDKQIKCMLKGMVECLDMDRGTVWEMIENSKQEARCLYSYTVLQFRHIQQPHMLSMQKFPWILRKVQKTEVVCVNRIDDLPEKASLDKKMLSMSLFKSGIFINFKMSGRVVMMIRLNCWHGEKNFSAEIIPTVRLAGEVIINAIKRKQMEENYKNAQLEMKQGSTPTHFEEQYIQQDEKHDRAYSSIVGHSSIMQTVFARMEQVSPTDSAVLIMGETGTGKGMIARAIHELSNRRDKPAVTVNCAALPSNLIESELFGREKGAFTGSDNRQVGRFEFADKSTLILDEIAELSPELQAKLLRVLQDGEFERLGSPKTIRVDVRIVALTSKDLKAEVFTGRFRQELYYRLNVFPITIPPLRERCDDIPLLVEYFVRKYSRKIGREIGKIPQHSIGALSSGSWPGNVRQLEHVIERAVIMTEGGTLHLAEGLKDEWLYADEERSVTNLAEVERNHILKVLNKAKGKIEGSGGAAILLGLHPNTLRARMLKLGINFRRIPS
jgi:formate hydrogenlyase transcriptional activator